MFRIKICGITNVEDARDAAEAGADAIGLNFYPKSKRFVDLATAEEVSRSLPRHVKRIGVFVNASADDINSIARQALLDGVQLHGDEPPELLVRLPRDVFIVRAFRCGRQGLAPLSNYLDECGALGRTPDALLIDADAGDQFGGTGMPANWAMISAERNAVGELPLILSGGLTPTNVAEAIELVLPHGVDVASGVERGPGKKDSVRVRHFIHAARDMFARI